MEKAKTYSLETAVRLILKNLIEAQTVWIEDGCFVGTASDGVVIEIGYDTKSSLEYLKTNPRPDMW